MWSRLAIAVVAGAAIACAAPAFAAQAPLRVFGNTSTIEIAPVLLAAQASGEAVAVANGGVPDLFRPGGADLATNAETQALRVTVDNPDLRIILTVSEGLYRIVARRSAGIRTLADLKGKRIATIPVTSSGYFLHRMLRTAGLDYPDVTVVPAMPLTRLADAIARREVDAVTIWEPEMDNVARRLGDDAIEFSGEGVYRELFNLNATRAQLADPRQRARIVAFVREVLRATRQLHADPAAAWSAVARSSGYDETTIARTWHHHRYPGRIAPDLLDVLEDEERYVARERQRSPRSRAALTQLIDASVLAEALEGHPELLVAAPSTEDVRLQAQRLRVERLSVGVRQASALRAVKRLQAAMNHYREAGQWSEAAALFTRDASALIGGARHAGRQQIEDYFRDQALAGTGRRALGEGDLNTHLLISPVLTFDPDGRVLRGRWHELSLTGRFGVGANWAGGIYENEYVEEGGVWKIRRLQYFPSFLGPYTPGWRNANRSEQVTVVPFHYSPDRAGTPLPLSPRPEARDRAPRTEREQLARVAQLRGTLLCLSGQSQVSNLQNAYGYYVDRRMWDDVADLFAVDGTFEAGQRGMWRGRARIRQALEQFGPQGLAHGVVHDHTPTQPVITMAPDCRSARTRVTELAMTGQNRAEAWWGVNIHENTFRLVGGVWKIASLRVTQRMRADYTQGWARHAVPAPAAPAGFAPDAPPTARFAAFPAFDVPPVHFEHPARGRGAPSRVPVTTADSLEHALADAERELDIAVAHDASENVSNAYGYYIDEFLWDLTSDLFAVNGSKELSYIGNYIGRERIRESMVARYGRGGRRAASMTLHQKTAPVINVAADGRSAAVRAKLVQFNSARDADGSYIFGVYENTTVRERGIWKLNRMDLDYTWTAGYTGGWARVAEGANRRFAPSAPLSPAPDGPLRGVTYAPYPDLAPMAFHYRNPVSGRAPPELLPP